MALLDKKIWGAFWRLLAQKRALSDSKLLDTLILHDEIDREKKTITIFRENE